jgi:hypothetical protein
VRKKLTFKENIGGVERGHSREGRGVNLNVFVSNVEVISLEPISS